MTVVDSNEDFLSVPENRRLLEILALKAKKTQAVIDEDYQNAHKLKKQIHNLCTGQCNGLCNGRDCQ